MRHHNQNRKLGRVRKVRKALLNSLARSLVLRNKIKTTEAKAKELRPFVEKLLNKGKTKSVVARRALGVAIGKEAAKILVDSLAKKYEDRNGGFLRIVKMNRRLSDGAKMAVIEFV
jgi:large subunit ribosomal protein L17